MNYKILILNVNRQCPPENHYELCTLIIKIKSLIAEVRISWVAAQLAASQEGLSSVSK
jgi:hypothetical protein